MALRCLVLVPVMNIWIVRMVMKQFTVYVEMAMSLARQHQFSMVVLVVPIVHMAVIVVKGAVKVSVAVTFGQVQPETYTHEQSTCHEIGSDCFSKDQN